MRSIIFSVSALLSATALLFLGSGLYGTLLAIRATGEGFSSSVIGVVMASYYLGFLIGCLHCHRLIQSVGHIRTYAALTAIASAATLAHALQVDAVTWSLLRVVVGFCLAGLYMTIESWLNEKATVESRGRIFAVYMMVNLGALGVGQLLLFAADTKSFALFAATSILLSLAAVPVSLASTTPPEITRSEPLRLLQLWRISPLALVACAAVGLSQGAFWSLTPVFTLSVGLSENGTALFMALAVLGGLVLQWPIGWFSDRRDRRAIITVVCGVAGIVAAAVAFAAGKNWIVSLYTLAVVYGGVSFVVYSLAISHANDHATATGIVSLSARLLLVYATGAIAGPLVSGWLVDLTSGAALFTFIAVVFMCVAAFGVWRLTRHPRPLAEEQTPFIALSRAGVAAGELDPRRDEEV